MGENRLKDMREDRDITQAELAKVLHCSQVCYSYYELGRRDIPTSVLHSLADFYGTSIDYLLCRTNVTRPYPKTRSFNHD